MKKAQSNVQKYLQERDWHNNEPSDIAKSIIIESAELLELFQWKNSKKKEIEKNPEFLAKLRGELADVCIYAIGMAVSLDMDIEEVILEKLAQIKKKYPVAEVKKGHKNYLKIKSEHRRNHA